MTSKPGPARVVHLWKDKEGFTFQYALVVGNEMLDAGNSGQQDWLQERADKINSALSGLVERSVVEGLVEALKHEKVCAVCAEDGCDRCEDCRSSAALAAYESKTGRG